MYDRGKIITGIVIAVILLLFPFWHQILYGGGKAEKGPELELSAKAQEAGECIEEKTTMRTQHMKILDEWRNEAAREGSRSYRSSSGKIFEKSLQNTCMSCHSNKSKFCDRCHDFAGVTPSCWECHIVPKERT